MATFSETNNTNLLSGGAGNNTIQGSTGQDWVDYNGKSGDYRIDRINGDWIVTDTNLSDGDDGRDVLRNVKGVRFANGQVDLVSDVYPEFRVNSYTAGYQSFAGVAALSDGGFVVVWNSLGQDGDLWGCFAQRYNAQGKVQGGEFRVNSYTSNWQSNAQIAALSDGGFVVTWQSDGQDGGGFGIYAQRYNAQGQVQGGDFRVNSYITNNQTYPSIAAMSDGGFVVTWQSPGQDGSGYGVYAQRYNAQGQMQGGEFQVNSTSTGDQRYPSITALNDGGFVVTWESAGQDDRNDWSGVYAQRYNAQGQLQGGEFRVNSYTTNSQDHACVTALRDGGFVVTWDSLQQDGDGWGVYCQRYNAQGQAQGSEFRVNTYTTGSQVSSSITALSDGRFVVTWRTDNQDLSLIHI
jgi:hypothetical protein